MKNGKNYPGFPVDTAGLRDGGGGPPIDGVPLPMGSPLPILYINIIQNGKLF
jgi:hypothetical protein